MATNEELFGILREVIRLPENFVESADLELTDSGLASLDMIEYIMELETRFGVNIPDEVIPSVTSVQKLRDYINERIN